MLPVSGAEQLNTSLDHGSRPISSAHSAYSRLVSCSPSNSKLSSTWALPECGGMNRFHSPASRAFGFSSSTTGMGFQRCTLVVLRAIVVVAGPDLALDEIPYPVAECALPVAQLKIHYTLFPAAWRTLAAILPVLPSFTYAIFDKRKIPRKNVLGKRARFIILRINLWERDDESSRVARRGRPSGNRGRRHFQARRARGADPRRRRPACAIPTCISRKATIPPRFRPCWATNVPGSWSRLAPKCAR